MTKKQVKNFSASVRQRLLNKARTDGRPFQELVHYYAMERFLYRLAQSRHANRFILKGALMLRIWQAPETRSTMDIDLLGKTDNDESALISHITDILSVEVDSDGLYFLPENIMDEHITEDTEYQEVRIWFPAKLDTMRLNIQIDIGFGDIIYPEPERSEIPVLKPISCVKIPIFIGAIFRLMNKHPLQLLQIFRWGGRYTFHAG